MRRIGVMPLTRHAPLLVAALILAAGCAQRPRVRATATPGTDFSKYRTYAIKPGNIVYPGASADRRGEIERRIQDGIAAELEGRGLVPQPEHPDLIVTYTAGAQQAAGVGGADTPTGAILSQGVDVRGGPSGYDEPGLVRPRENEPTDDVESRRRYREGNLVIDLLDGKTHRLVWRATASEVELASDRSSVLLDSIIRQAFEGLNIGVPAGESAATTRPASRAVAPTTRP